MSFTGQAGEYFRIWIVNLCLTIVTLGIYLPWAIVRQRSAVFRKRKNLTPEHRHL